MWGKEYLEFSCTADTPYAPAVLVSSIIKTESDALSAESSLSSWTARRDSLLISTSFTRSLRKISSWHYVTSILMMRMRRAWRRNSARSTSTEWSISTAPTIRLSSAGSVSSSTIQMMNALSWTCMRFRGWDSSRAKIFRKILNRREKGISPKTNEIKSQFYLKISN